MTIDTSINDAYVPPNRCYLLEEDGICNSTGLRCQYTSRSAQSSCGARNRHTALVQIARDVANGIIPGAHLERHDK